MSPSAKLSFAICSVMTGILIAAVSINPDHVRAQTEQDPADPFNTPAEDDNASGNSDFVVPDPFGNVIDEDESSDGQATDENPVPDPFGNVIDEPAGGTEQTEVVNPAGQDPFSNVIQEDETSENGTPQPDPFGEMPQIEAPDPFGQLNSLSSDPSTDPAQGGGAFGTPPAGTGSYNPATSLDLPPSSVRSPIRNPVPPSITPEAAEPAANINNAGTAFPAMSPSTTPPASNPTEPSTARDNTPAFDPQPLTPPPTANPPSGEPGMRDITPPFTRGAVNFSPAVVPQPAAADPAVTPAAAVTTQPVSTAPGPRTQTIPTGDESGDFAELFYRYLQANNYRNWSPAPGNTDRFNRGSGPHGVLNKLYLNRTALTSIDDLSFGSVIVMENYGSDRSLTSIAAMMKSDRFNPRGGDWFWVEYDADGNVISDEVGLISGRLDSCIQCHSAAGGDDFLFSNDLNIDR